METQTSKSGRGYHLVEERAIPRPIDEVFAYASDFANSQHWDPGVESAAKTSDGSIGVGTTYALSGHFGPGKIDMKYEITEFEPNRLVVLEGSGKGFTSRDEMLFEAVKGGTLINYTADITLTNALRFLGPLLNRSFERMGTKALDGLEKELSQ